MQRPASSEYAPYYQNYIKLVPDGDIIDILSKQNEQFCTFLATVSESQAEYRYAKGKWNIKEIIGHLIESEQIFAYRALRISRGDKTPLPGFEQDLFVAKGRHSHFTLSELVEHFYLQRKTTIAMLSRLDDKMSRRKGTASDNTVSVRALAWIIAGHVIHHMQQIRKNYLK